MELTNEMWKCVISAMYSLAGVVISGRNDSSPHQQNKVCNAVSLASSCMMYTSIKKSSTSVMLKLCNSQTLWWVFYQTKKSSRLNSLNAQKSAQKQCVSYTVLHSVTSSASKSLWTSRRLLKSDFVSQGKEEIYPFIWEFMSDQK